MFKPRLELPTSPVTPASPTLNSAVSERFSSFDTDLVIKSSDGTLFRVHRANLSAHSPVFPGSEFATDDDPVVLQESAEILELLFQHVYPVAGPSVGTIPFGTFKLLAEAAEKYQIFRAMEVCLFHMPQHIQTHPLDVLAYACKHGYVALSDEAAPWTLQREPREARKILDPSHFAKWVIYREHWIVLRNTAPIVNFTSVGGAHLESCIVHWTNFKSSLVNRMNLSLDWLRDVDHFWSETTSLVALRGCSSCQNWWSWWRSALKVKVQNIPSFSSIELDY